MRRLLCFMFLLTDLLWTGSTAFAQERTISGRVTGEDNKALPGVTIRVRGTQKITVSNATGNFSIQAKAGDVLQFSFVGRRTNELTIGSSDAVDVQMSTRDDVMGEIVVTAMDMRRNKRELSYSTQTVSGAEIQETQRENFITGLQGRVAGLTVNTTSGLAGSSSAIVLRGFNSLSMSNQPLFVIDGVIVDNTSLDENSFGGTGVGIVERGAGLTSTNNQKSDYTNRISDMNPSDIESITVLKGPEATALYGSQASSGAIVITTRKAKSTKLAVQYDNSFRVQKITRFPEMFDGYIPGTNGDTSSVFRYFGPAYAPGTMLYNNKESFFKTGTSQTHNLGADFGFKNSMFRFSGSFFDQDGVVQNNGYRRYTLRLSNTTRFGQILDITPSVTYINTENNKVLRSAGGFMLSLLSWPNTNDIRNYGDNATKTPLFANNTPNQELDNPLFSVNSNKSYDKTERINTALGINLNPFSWLSLSGRFGYEKYSTDGYTRFHPMSYYLSQGTGGLQDNYYRRYTGYNHTLTATVRKTIGKDFNFRVMGGTMWQDYETKQNAISGTNLVDSIVRGVMYKGGQAVTNANFDQLLGSPADSNATRFNTRQRLLRNVFGEFNRSILRQFAYFGEFAFNYKNVVFVNYSHRFEQASTLPEKNRRYNYPGAGISLIVSELLPGIKDQNVINYFKLRGSVARTARLNTPYSTQSVFVNNLASGGGFSYGFTNNNADLAPELQQTFELGMEWRLLNNKVNFEATYYNTLNKGQIVESFRLSYGTGFVLNTQNAGSTRNQGIELSFDVTPIRKKNFTYNTRVNFNHMWNRVIALPKNVAEYYIADTWVFGNARGGLILGNPTTTITGFGYQRNTRGDILISPTTGLPIIENAFKIRGDRNPDFTIGWNNSFSYKNLRLSFLWDLKKGGDIYNGTEQYLTTIGRSKLTADRMTPRVISGVLSDGLENSANPTFNNISIIPFYNDQYYRTLPEEAFIEKDVNWFRLRDITLSYTFPESFAKRIRGMKNLGVFVTANELILITNYSGADPGVNGGSAGSRGVGAFGFDYGTLPAPVSVNVGFRASF